MCNPNCTATVLVMGLAPLQQAFGIERVFMTSMQAISGAGYPGVPSLDILGNVIPFIRSEEDKVEEETPKMLGRFEEGAVNDDELRQAAARAFTPTRLGPLALRNRFVKTATFEGMSPHGVPSSALVEHHRSADVAATLLTADRTVSAYHVELVATSPSHRLERTLLPCRPARSRSQLPSRSSCANANPWNSLGSSSTERRK